MKVLVDVRPLGVRMSGRKITTICTVVSSLIFSENLPEYRGCTEQKIHEQRETRRFNRVFSNALTRISTRWLKFYQKSVPQAI